ncbi:MAG: hypothetical protein COW19_10470 [Zetaproteobacteria bacterium CG12_big_fil_rev_8_21_14_0_65_55_1124]|nr:MAG: hypothetical protein AUJ58_11635 [Zetaproteobacteria bacterium CG1_02_55_237]PIS18586.1 MAG: hypothetical protein COT53_10380 [Zetaproteobacteria bacterium CG08_land_8_20_14_0_20_55_17]PIW42062.1 MAG: hypothetical protein COW19_10470 [Zetaproteobacteria bacterium CG12_big_fil_rev_8_21_14_0_65_55_1124]PIY53967.1 MAG: hypothetical protein COZ01_02295 [Zetaproteobacteria bacterium CG_4_10_14_0_8_um_filter_55_43]PIZ39413.1 MAG: hypothetical protein COY36_03330 [Zetaproteobacteria bacterium 
MSNTKPSWKPGKKDALFLGVVLLVIVLLVLGSSERTTKATPNDDVHRAATSHETCMTCHGKDGVRPQPVGHASSVQCFQCHTQPKDWQGAGK